LQLSASPWTPRTEGLGAGKVKATSDLKLGNAREAFSEENRSDHQALQAR
jgi:hypothetical protein